MVRRFTIMGLGLAAVGLLIAGALFLIEWLSGPASFGREFPSASLADPLGDTMLRGRQHDPRVDITGLEAVVERETLVVVLSLDQGPTAEDAQVNGDKPYYQIILEPDDAGLREAYHLMGAADRSRWQFGFTGPNVGVSRSAEHEFREKSLVLRVPLADLGHPSHVRLMAYATVDNGTEPLTFERDMLPTQPEFDPPDEDWLNLDVGP